MPLNLAMSVMSVVEFILWTVLGLLFWKKRLHRRFRAMSLYLGLRVGSAPVLLTLLYGQSQHWFSDYGFVVYFSVYWAVYSASAVLLFLVCTEVFRSALSSFPGLMKFGVVVFRWAALACVVVSFSTIGYSAELVKIIPDIVLGLMRSVSVIELCLLGFLCFSMNALRLSPRSLAFGIALGFGIMSTSDFIMSAVLGRDASLVSPVQFVCESLILVGLSIWITYCAVPEPAPKAVTVPVNSTVYRWNEIASALGHTGTQVAVEQHEDGFFLSDVERVVDKVLNRTLKSKESES